jgi:hypothetical protein
MRTLGRNKDEFPIKASYFCRVIYMKLSKEQVYPVPSFACGIYWICIDTALNNSRWCY